MKRTIMHVDMDAFYAAIEMREDPSLRDKPIVVGTGPNVSKGSGTVTTANYPARKHGIRSGMRLSQAKKLHKDMIIIPMRRDLYLEVSKKVMEILDTFSDVLEQVSIDEAFLDVTERIQSYEMPTRLAKEIKEEVLRQEKLTCSIGIAETKEIAKIASGLEKPDGLTFIPPEKINEVISPLPIRKIRGIGPKTEKLLKEEGIHTINDLKKLKINDLKRFFRGNAKHFYQVVRGKDEGEVQPRAAPKSLSLWKNFGKNTSNLDEITRGLKNVAERLHNRVSKYNFKFKTISLYIQFADFKTITKSQSLSFHENRKDLISSTAIQLLQSIMGNDTSLRRVGIRISNFKKAQGKDSIKIAQKELKEWF